MFGCTMKSKFCTLIAEVNKNALLHSLSFYLIFIISSKTVISNRENNTNGKKHIYQTFKMKIIRCKFRILVPKKIWYLQL